MLELCPPVAASFEHKTWSSLVDNAGTTKLVFLGRFLEKDGDLISSSATYLAAMATRPISNNTGVRKVT